MGIARFISSLWKADERRRHPRRRSPAVTLIVDRRKTKTINWSLGGCLVAAAELGNGSFKVGDRVSGDFRLARTPDGAFQAEVMRATPGGELGLRWLEISSSTFAAMSAKYG